MQKYPSLLKFVAVLIIVVVFSLTFLNNTGSVQAANTHNWVYEEQQFTSLMNNYRASQGLSSLSRSSCLTNAIRSWTEQLAASNSDLYHSDVSELMRTYCGQSYSNGEILYYGLYASAESALEGWKNSPGHNRIILTDGYDYAGAGFVFNSSTGRTYAGVMFADCDSGCPSSLTTAPNDSGFSSYASQCTYITPSQSKIYPGDTFDVSLAFTVTGTATWFKSSDNAYWAGTGANPWGTDKAKMGGDIAALTHFNPGLEAWHTLTVKAPSTPGAYELRWRMKHNGSFFGATCAKSVNILSKKTSDTSKPSSGAGQPSSDIDSTNAEKPATPTAQIISIDGAEIASSSTEEVVTFRKNEQILLRGKTIPNGLVKLYIFSKPQEAEVEADENGNWSYTIKSIEPGDHRVEIEVTDPKSGETSERAEVLTFVVNEEEASNDMPTKGTPEELSPARIDDANEHSILFIALAGVAGIGFIWLLIVSRLKPVKYIRRLLRH